MKELTWQKSTFSGGGGSGECIEVALSRDGLVLLRESDRPAKVIAADAQKLAALITAVKTGGW